MTGPLTGVVIVDLTEHIAGPYATKLFADFGADVIKIERPAGDPARRLGPFKDGRKHPEASGTFFYFNTNKRSVVLNLKSESGRRAFWHLIDKAHVVVESFMPGALDRLGVGWKEIHERRPLLSLVSISNFGQTSPYRDYEGSELVLYGYAGEMFSTGSLAREPVKVYGTAALVQSGSAFATAIFGALFASRKQQPGRHIDFSIADSHLVGVDRRHATVVGEQYSGRKTLRPRPATPAGMVAGLFRCKDGWLELAGGGARFRNIREFLGHPQWIEDPKWDDAAIQTDPDAIAEFRRHFDAWLAERTKREIWEAARKVRFLCGPLFTIEEVYADDHFESRGLWQEAETPDLGRVRFPGRPFLMSRTPWEYRRAAPRLGEHTREVLAAAGLASDEIEAAVLDGGGGI